MPQLWLIPADEQSFNETLAKSRNLTPAPDKPDGFPDHARVWGVRTDPEHPDAPWKRNERNLEKMEPGDPLLVYRNSESRYVGAGRIGGPLWHTEWVRDRFWDGGPALDVFHIDRWAEIDLAPETVNRILEYEDSFWPQGLWRVADDRRTSRLVQRLEQEGASL